MHIRTTLKGVGRRITSACSGPGEGQAPITRFFDHLASMSGASLEDVLDVCAA